MRLRARPYFELLRHNPDFTRLYAAQLASFAGDWFATVALLGLALEMTNSAVLASLVLVLQTGGFAAAAPVAGMLADRLDRRRLMITADVARIPVALGFLLARDADSLWIAFVCVGLLSAGAAFFEPTSAAALPNLVEPRRLPEANVLIGAAWGTMLAVGAGIGGVVAVVLGRDAAFIVNALSFAVSGVLIWTIRRPMQQPRAPDAAPHTGLVESLRVAIRFARARRLVAAFVLSKTTFGVGTGVVALLAVFGSRVFGGGDEGIGILFAARGLGALIGPFLARAIVGIENRGLLLGIGGSLIVVCVSYALFPAAPAIWLAAPLVFAAHLGGGAQWMLSTLGLQRATPDELRGRLFSFDYGLVTLVITVSTLLAGTLADAYAPAVAVWAMVGLIIIAGLGWLALAWPLLRATQHDIAAGPPSSDRMFG
ncbi:MAG TPA: MFS transporter [Candidatus Limnocylindrales bacterium]|jgi:predicted MFS family arabinose efflux permease|nr:MFS transporter [Candidatus Limnocylindrales bacterium]